MSRLEDKEIIALYCERDERAIRETETKYGGLCLSVASNILDSREDSEECVNDTWLRLWNSIPPSKPASLKAYISKIARNLALSKYQRSHAVKRGGGEIAAVYEEVGEFISDTESIETAERKREFVECLERFLDSLSARERSIFLRRYFFSESIARIADVHNISEENTHTLLSRIRAKLKKHLKKEGYTI